MMSAIILAAGDGKRMKSNSQKVCCKVLFKPMLCWVLDSCKSAAISAENTCVVISDTPNGVLELLPPNTKTATQHQRLGTGHAVFSAKSFLEDMLLQGIEHTAVLCGDAPFITSETLNEAFDFHKQQGNVVTVLTATLASPASYGRIVRENGAFKRIVEFADADQPTREICEVNSGAYWFSIKFLLAALDLIKTDNAQGEYYLTDTVAIAVETNKTVGAFVCSDSNIVLGANDRASLSALNEIAQKQILDKHLANGVDIPFANSVVIGADVTIAPDTTIMPNTIITGKTTIGGSCVIGPNTQIIDCFIGEGTVIDSSRLEQSKVGAKAKIGPFAQLRPNCIIADSVKIGNFVEVKNSVVGEKTSLAHLTYIGDSDLGHRINVGCGVVTVNYNGKEKFRTTVEDDAFIGCNTNLIAPVTVEKGGYVAAGTTVTQNVPADALAVGRAKQRNLPRYALQYRKQIQK